MLIIINEKSARVQGISSNRRLTENGRVDDLKYYYRHAFALNPLDSCTIGLFHVGFGTTNTRMGVYTNGAATGE
jgi:hypothetical protein